MNHLGGHEYFQKLMDKADIKFVKQVDPSRTYGFYLKAGEEIYTSANHFHKDGLLEEAFILYCRFTMLFVNILKKDKLSNEEPYASRFSNLKKLATYAMDQCEVIKKNLLDQEKHGVVSLNPSSIKIQKSKDEIDEFESLRVDNSIPKSVPTTRNAPINVQTNLINVKIDMKLIEKFNFAARSNMMNNLEFCGILAGFLVGSSKDKCFQVSHCFIPKQDCTEDSCRALNEITVFNRQELLGLVTLGWIHTHPTQDCFLSTVDLKTQYGYQCSLPEALGIVLAPRANKKLGIFRVKDNFSKDKSINGMEKIRNQFRKNIEWGNNHEATDCVWFEDCSHVQTTKTDSEEFCTIVDLR